MYNHAINRYLEQQIVGTTSFNLIIAMFDFTLAGCMTRDAGKTMRGLTALERSLSFHGCPELAYVFCSLYGYCRGLISEDRFEQTHSYLQVLRDAWAEARERRTAAPEPTP
jgi:hypothetical protein